MSILIRFYIIGIIFLFSSLTRASGHAIKNVPNEIASFWLSHSYVINPLNKNRFTFHNNFSSALNKNKINYYPDIGFGFKVSKNLVLVTSVFAKNLEESSLQVIGSGVQYFFGSLDTLKWVTSLERVDMKVLRYFYISNLTFDFSKWFHYKVLTYRLGSGTSFFKKHNYSNNANSPKNQTGQINFLFISVILPVQKFNIGIETKMNKNRIFFSLIFNKEFF